MKKPYKPPTLVNSEELCKELAAMAGFLDDHRARNIIYKAVRQLQLLDKLAAETSLSNGNRA